MHPRILRLRDIFYIQGVSHWNVSFKLTLTDRNMQVRFCLKVTVYSWGLEIWVSLTSFQKINLGWPQQPPPENLVWVFIILSKHIFFKTSKWNFFSPQTIEFKNKDSFEVLLSDFSDLKNLCSLIDLSGLCNLSGLNSLYSPISSKNFLILMVWTSITPKWPIVVIFCGMDHQERFHFGTWNSNLERIYRVICEAFLSCTGGCCTLPVTCKTRLNEFKKFIK